MAKVTCTLTYDKGQLTKTYGISLDANDTIQVVSNTANVVIKAQNEHAKKLFPTVLKGKEKVTHTVAAAHGKDAVEPQTGTVYGKVQVHSETTAAYKEDKAGSDPAAEYEFDVPMAAANRNQPRAKQITEPFCFTVSQSGLATFLCGNRDKDGNFQEFEYKGGRPDGPTFPNGDDGG